jgi:hypothetical protein
MTEQKHPMIYKAMASILKDVDAITKSRTNTQGATFKYRGIDDIYNELHKAFADNKVFCTTTVLDRKQEERLSKSGGNLFYTVCTVEFKFYAEDGSFVTSTIMGEAMDSGDKSTNKAMAIAHKYCLLQAFLIPTEDDKDADAQTHQVVHREAPKTAYYPKKEETKPSGLPGIDPQHSPALNIMKAFTDLNIGVTQVENFVMKPMKDWDDKDIEVLRARWKDVVAKKGVK